MAGLTDADNYPAAGDPEKAKRCSRSWLDPPDQDDHPDGERQAGMSDIAQTIQAQLKAVGIDAEVE